MVFSSYHFLLIFLPLTLLGFYGLRGFGARTASVTFLLFASVIFYGVWNLGHLALLAGSIIANYGIGILLSGNRPSLVRRGLIYAGVIGNLSLIFWFKYLDFTLSNVATLSGTTHTFYNFILPLGISFFTFQQIAYLVDCYKTKDPELRIRDYALFVSFFPQLIAGPIVHHRLTRPQFQAVSKNPINRNDIVFGLMIFAIGLTKKTLIADPIARSIGPIFDSAAAGDIITASMSAFATIGYTLQIYFDFSGYCDMAIGLGLMVGIRLPMNFNSPYKSKSIIEFWRRWHITLSTFLRDYIYIPFGGNRKGEIFKLRNIFITMLIGGIWHGAAWTFIIWGAIHASLITLNHAARLWLPALDRVKSPVTQIAKQAALLVAIMIAWVYFRADSINAAHTVLAGFTHLAPSTAEFDPFIICLMMVGTGLALFAPNALELIGYSSDNNQQLGVTISKNFEFMRPSPISAMMTALMLSAGIAVAWRPAIFIYFNF